MMPWNSAPGSSLPASARRFGDLDLVDDRGVRDIDHADVAGAEVGDVEQRAVRAEGQIVRLEQAVDAGDLALLLERDQRDGAGADVADREQHATRG